MAHIPDHSSNIYLAVSLTGSSKYKSESIVVPPATDVGYVGALDTVKLLSVPKDKWTDAQERITEILNGDKENIESFAIQQPKLRTKRGGDEL